MYEIVQLIPQSVEYFFCLALRPTAMIPVVTGLLDSCETRIARMRIEPVFAIEQPKMLKICYAFITKVKVR